ncbi:unnamed protein product, partial [Ectocarpus sp. 13 AM-2016]
PPGGNASRPALYNAVAGGLRPFVPSHRRHGLSPRDPLHFRTDVGRPAFSPARPYKHLLLPHPGVQELELLRGQDQVIQVVERPLPRSLLDRQSPGAAHVHDPANNRSSAFSDVVHGEGPRFAGGEPYQERSGLRAREQGQRRVLLHEPGEAQRGAVEPR